MFAPAIVKHWANLAELAHVDPKKIRQAREIGLARGRWPKKKVPG